MNDHIAPLIPLEFPDSPAVGDRYDAPNGFTYIWDGTVWTVPGSGSAPPADALVPIGPNPPANPQPGQLWWRNDPDATLYIFYFDGTTSQWVPATPAGVSGAYLPLTGGTLTGPLILSVDPIAGAQQATTKAYVDSLLSPLTSAVGVDIGDVKHSFKTYDHNGWIKLDGRNISTLTASQQNEALGLGFPLNLPDATDSVLMQNGNMPGAITGSWTLTQANLPDINLTTTNAGLHTHFVQQKAGTSMNFKDFDGRDPNNGFAAYSGDGMWQEDPTQYAGQAIGDNRGDHTHTVSLGGSDTPITPKQMSVNYFVFLGA
jgi:hypothetical protein